ncbi:MAG TPA: hypothetical protein PLL30_08430 [Candidatus Krumholzibacteria bacterium]|nr:hypothetical protein [Candidatus Krumholzibacteria bacterium]HPD71784.1 hypothetical protein [Candidatus Krumholzibacteria bacterium]HRY41283.1 hypothetical protein [Candidatus Krumholzibacteria bacterium]
MKLTIILGVLASLALLGACDDSTEPDTMDSDIRGHVVDAQGEPVAGATVILQHDVDPPLPFAHDKPQTGIEFDLPEAGPVTMWIASFCDGDTLRMLVDGELPPGQHVVVWDGLDDAGRVLPDGVYRMHLRTEAGETHQELALLHVGYEGLDPDAVVAPLAVTDDEGEFTLSQECLPFGFTFDRLDENGDPIGTSTITREVRIWAFSAAAGAVGASGWAAVDPETGAEVTVTLGR